MNNLPFIDEEQVAGSGMNWTLAYTPKPGTVQLYAEGQRLDVGSEDYTISGKNIITTLPWPAGSVFADYMK